MARWIHPHCRPIAFALLAACLTAGTSCQMFRKPAPPPLAPPEVVTRLQHYMGTPLSGPTLQPVDTAAQPQNAWGLKITLIALDAMPDTGAPLGAEASLIAATRGGEPVLPSRRLTIGARVLDEKGIEELLNPLPPPSHHRKNRSASLPHAAVLGEFDGALLPGVTSMLTATEPLGMSDPAGGGAAQRGFAIYIGRSTAAAAVNPPMLRIGVMAEDLYSPPKQLEPAPEATGAKGKASAKAPPPATNPDVNSEEIQPALMRELALLDRPAPPNASAFAVVVPMQFAHSSARAIAAVIEVSPVSDVLPFAQAMSDLQRSADVAAHRPGSTPFNSGGSSAVATAMASLQSPHRRRSALVFMSGLGSAGLCENVAMVADDATLDRMAREITKRVESQPALPDGDALGWILESATLHVLSDQLTNSRLSPELSAVLTAYAGEAGRHSASMEDICKAASGKQDLENRLIAENYIFLEDNSPASRVRALDWLRGKNKAPADYDPLASPRQRRQALDKAVAAMSDPSAAPANAPTSAPATEPTQGVQP